MPFTKTIETERLLMRPFTEDDIEPSYQLNLDAEISKYTHDGGVISREEMDERIKEGPMRDYTEHGFGRFAVEWKETGEFIGFSGLKYLPEYDEVDLGYRFRRDMWGKGIATESSLPCLAWGFTELDLTHIIAIALPDNKASFRVMEKVGMSFEKELEVEGLMAVQWGIYR